ncbi:MAG: AAA family ATPase [Planctomycetota bacterium]
MRSIAIINQKGGVGKTTTTVHLAAGLANAGQRVLLIDLDPQAHTSLHLGTQLAPEQLSIYDVLVHDTALADALHNVNDQLTLLPASLDLIGAELELGTRNNRDMILSEALHTCNADFDICLIDCPPSLGLLTINALAAVDEVLIPLQAHFLALQGLSRLLETVTLVREVLNPRLCVTGVVLCMFERGTRLAQEVLADITQFLANAAPEEPWYEARVFNTRIRRNIKLAECPSFGQTVFEYAPGSHGAEDYHALANELLGTQAVDESQAMPTPVSRPVEDVLPAPEITSAGVDTRAEPLATADDVKS